MAASSAAYGEAPELPKHEGMVPALLSPYASGKVAGEHLLVYGICYGIKTVALYFNVRPRQADDSPYTGVIAIFVRELLRGRTPTIFVDGGRPATSRSWTTWWRPTSRPSSARRSPAWWSTSVAPSAFPSAISIRSSRLIWAVAEPVGARSERAYPPQPGGHRQGPGAPRYEPSVRWQDGLRETLAWYRGRQRRASGLRRGRRPQPRTRPRLPDLFARSEAPRYPFCQTVPPQRLQGHHGPFRVRQSVPAFPITAATASTPWASRRSQAQFGLTDCSYRANLSKEELFQRTRTTAESARTGSMIA